jgi:hypothetical protein
VADSCGHDNEFLDAMKDEEFLHELRDYQLLENGSLPWI